MVRGSSADAVRSGAQLIHVGVTRFAVPNSSELVFLQEVERPEASGWEPRR